VGFVGLLAVVAAVAGAFLYCLTLFEPISRDATPVTVDIPMGASASAIGEKLESAGLIRNATAFSIAARVTGDGENMKAGEYAIPRNMGLLQIIEKLAAGDAEQQWITIPEGKTLRQVAGLLTDRNIAKSGEFMTAVERRPARYGLPFDVPRRNLEGYLMPDSYKFQKQTSERDLVKAMVKNWIDTAYLPNKAAFDAAGMTPDQIVIIASLIEREARVPQDRKLISSVIRNRLAKKMPLQIDATVIFALGRHKPVVTFKDLKVDSKYNTYKYPGLPPGPICSPGVASIEAALNPAKTDYLYYVAQADGSHIFTRSLDEHNAAIAKVRRARKSGSG
jgi:UPF0755 protein